VDFDRHPYRFGRGPTSNIGTLTATLGAESTNGTTGTVNWTYTVGDTAIAYLAVGQTLTQTYTVNVNDGTWWRRAPERRCHSHRHQRRAVVTSGSQSGSGRRRPPAPISSPTRFRDRHDLGWTLNTNDASHDKVHYRPSPIPARQNMEFGQDNSDATLSQTIATTAGKTYTIDFWLMNNGTAGNRTSACLGCQDAAGSDKRTLAGYTNIHSRLWRPAAARSWCSPDETTARGSSGTSTTSP